MTPKKIALLTDSSADLRWDQARENNIFFVPLRILCEDGEYLDGVNITGPDIYQRLHNGELPQTSLPRVEDFSAKLREIFDLGYDGVIAVMLSSGLSGTYNLARILAGECAEQGYAMKVFDSVSGALGQGMTVLQLAEDIKNGMGWEELTERRAPQLIANTYPFFSVDTLEYLARGGRIPKAVADVGMLVKLKPLVTVSPDGLVAMAGKAIGRHRAGDAIMKLMERHPIDPRYPLIPLYTGGRENCIAFLRQTAQAGYACSIEEAVSIGPTIGSHVGPGAFGVAYISA